MSQVKLFIKDCLTKYGEFELGLRAGYIDEDGIICNGQMGAIDTFSVGMPVYSEDGVEIGKLSIGLWKNLNWSQDKVDFEIPAHHWRVDGYKGERQTVKTYHQVASLTDKNKGGVE